MDSIDLSFIQIPEGRREVKPESVDQLAASMDALGLMTPITVYAPSDDAIFLVAGAHRVAAAIKLGWEEIDCVFTTADELDRELWEIDENLIRADLTELERAGHLKRRKEIFDAKASVRISDTSKGGTDSKGRGNKAFDRDTADKTGIPKSTLNQSRNRAEKIADDVQERIADKPEIADKGVELDALASLSHDEQRQAVKMVEDEAAVNIRDAHAFIKGETPEEVAQKKRRDGCWSKFAKLTPEDRAWFFAKLKSSGYVSTLRAA